MDDAAKNAGNDEPEEDDTDRAGTMAEEGLAQILQEALEGYADIYGDLHEEKSDERAEEVRKVRVTTFEEEGVLTRNKGLVVRIGEAEFQVSIVRSR